jgi:hypothetical protein
MLVPIGDPRGVPWANRRLVCNRYRAGQTEPLDGTADFPTMRLENTKFWGRFPPP